MMELSSLLKISLLINKWNREEPKLNLRTKVSTIIFPKKKMLDALFGQVSTLRRLSTNNKNYLFRTIIVSSE